MTAGSRNGSMECLALETHPAESYAAPVAPLPPAPRPARSFEQLVADEQPRVTRLARRLLGWPGDVEDVVQEIFLAALRGWDRFRQQSQAETWLTRIAINCCRSHERRRRLGWGFWRRVARLAEGVAKRHSAVDAADRLEVEDAAAEVRAAVAALGQGDREVIVLHYLDERSIDDVARTLGASRSVIDVRLCRARKRLRALLGDREAQRKSGD